MHKQITTSASKMTFESKWKLMWIFKQGVNIAVTDVLIVDAVKTIVDSIDDVVVVVIVVVVAEGRRRLKKNHSIIWSRCLINS